MSKAKAKTTTKRSTAGNDQAARQSAKHRSKKGPPLPFGLDLKTLPFVTNRKCGGQSHWHVKPSGKYGEDCATGEAYARAFLPFLQINLGVAMLGMITRSMIEAKDESGLVIGFMAAIARATAQGVGVCAELYGSTATSEPERARLIRGYWRAGPGLHPIAGSIASDPRAPSSLARRAHLGKQIGIVPSDRKLIAFCEEAAHRCKIYNDLARIAGAIPDAQPRREHRIAEAARRAFEKAEARARALPAVTIKGLQAKANIIATLWGGDIAAASESADDVRPILENLLSMKGGAA